MRVRGRSEFFLPSYTRCARSISMSRSFKEGIHLERLTLRKPATSEPSAPSGNPASRTLFLLLLSSISVIFSVSCSSWFLKSVTVLLSSRAAAWTESTRSRVCFAALASAHNQKWDLVLSKDPVLRYQVGTKKIKTSRYQVSVNPVLAARSESCADALSS